MLSLVDIVLTNTQFERVMQSEVAGEAHGSFRDAAVHRAVKTNIASRKDRFFICRKRPQIARQISGFLIHVGKLKKLETFRWLCV